MDDPPAQVYVAPTELDGLPYTKPRPGQEAEEQRPAWVAAGDLGQDPRELLLGHRLGA